MNVLVGHTGFVGSNIFASGEIDQGYNTKNIKDAYGLNPDLLIYAGLRAEKYLANQNPEQDMLLISEAKKNISEIKPRKLVLISTIDVFKNPVDVNEKTAIDTEGLGAYGRNRYNLECWVRQHDPNALIVRLPGLFGINIKKNFIFDLINMIPTMLTPEKLDELSKTENRILDFYDIQDNGFYKCRNMEQEEKIMLKNLFCNLGFTALNFTDSRSRFQFYPLARLWNDIKIALNNDIKLFHPATEPLSAGELFEFITCKSFHNILKGDPANYDYRTLHDTMFGGSNGYICNKETLKSLIKQFVEKHENYNF